MKAKEYFFQRNKNAKENLIYDLIENIYQNDSDLDVEILNEIVEIQKKSKISELIYSNESRFNMLLSFLIENSNQIEIKSLKNKLYVGVTNDFIFNAKAVTKIENEYLIEIYFGIYDAIDLFGNVISRIGLTLDSNFNPNLVDSKLINADILMGIREIEKICKVFQSKSIYNSENKLFKYWGSGPIKNKLTIMATKIKISMYTFVILHEIGHHIFGHLEGFMSDTLDEISQKLFKIKEKSGKYTMNQLQEFEADLFATNYLLNLNKYNKGQSFLIALDKQTSSLSILAIMHLMANVIGNINTSDDNHPPLADRIELILSLINLNLSLSEYIEVTSAYQSIISKFVEIS